MNQTLIYENESYALLLKELGTEELAYIPFLYTKNGNDEELEFTASGLMFRDKSKAADAAKLMYWKMCKDLKNLKDGDRLEVDYRIIPRNWKNASIYPDKPEDDKNLLRALLCDGGEVETVTLNPSGIPIKGNRRVRCASQINEQDIVEGKVPRFLRIPVKIKTYPSEQLEIKSLTEDNETQRDKTKAKSGLDRVRPALILEAFYNQKATKRLSIAQKIKHGSATKEEVREYEETGPISAHKEVANTLGVSSGTYHHMKTVHKFINQNDDEEINELLKRIDVLKASKTTFRALKAFQKPDGEEVDRDLVIKALKEIIKKIESKSRDYNIEAIVKSIVGSSDSYKVDEFVPPMVATVEEAKPSIDSSDLDFEKLRKTAKGRKTIFDALGFDHYEELRTSEAFTDHVISFFLNVSERPIDVDAFSDIGCRVPARSHVTRIEDAYQSTTKLMGNVFANIWGIQGCLPYEALSREIDNGATERLIMISSYDIIEKYHYFVEKHDLGFLILDESFLFNPSEFSVSGDIRQPAVISFYSAYGREDHHKFKEHFTKHCSGAYYHALRKPHVTEESALLTDWVDNRLTLFGRNLRVSQGMNSYEVYVEGEKGVSVPLEMGIEAARGVAIAQVIQLVKNEKLAGVL